MMKNWLSEALISRPLSSSLPIDSFTSCNNAIISLYSLFPQKSYSSRSPVSIAGLPDLASNLGNDRDVVEVLVRDEDRLAVDERVQLRLVLLQRTANSFKEQKSS